MKKLFHLLVVTIVAIVLITAHVEYIIPFISFTFTLSLIVGPSFIHCTLSPLSIIFLIAKTSLEVFSYRPVTYVALEIWMLLFDL
jgi:hypothetical protein